MLVLKYLNQEVLIRSNILILMYGPRMLSNSTTTNAHFCGQLTVNLTYLVKKHSFQLFFVHGSFHEVLIQKLDQRRRTPHQHEFCSSNFYPLVWSVGDLQLSSLGAKSENGKSNRSLTDKKMVCWVKSYRCSSFRLWRVIDGPYYWSFAQSLPFQRVNCFTQIEFIYYTSVPSFYFVART